MKQSATRNTPSFALFSVFSKALPSVRLASCFKDWQVKVFVSCVITKSISNWKKFLLLYIASKYPKLLNWPFLSSIKFISKLFRWISLSCFYFRLTSKTFTSLKLKVWDGLKITVIIVTVQQISQKHIPYFLSPKLA